MNVQRVAQKDSVASATIMGSGSVCWVSSCQLRMRKVAVIVENTFHEKGGPARHLHHEQDEWFYAVEGPFTFEIGEERFVLTPDDSVPGPKRVPHVWAYTGGGT